MKENLLGYARLELRALMQKQGLPAFRGDQIFQAIHQKGITDFASMSTLSLALRSRFDEEYLIAPPPLRSESSSPDGTRKYLFDVSGGGAVEAIYIPEPERATLCISSQVGCLVNCRFCYTAKQGFQKNLSAAEIIGQVWMVVHRLLPAEAVPVTNIVFMGMGEPLLNYEAVRSTTWTLLDDKAYGYSKRRVTLSTSGVVPVLNQWIEECDAALAVSLHAADDTLRSHLVPMNRKYPLSALLESCLLYNRLRGRAVVMEYVMLEGVNDSLEHAKALHHLLQGIDVKINLIPFNPFKGTEYQRSAPEVIERFSRFLQSKGLLCFVRKTRGDPILAACGQLAGDVSDRTRRAERYLAGLDQSA